MPTGRQSDRQSDPVTCCAKRFVRNGSRISSLTVMLTESHSDPRETFRNIKIYSGRPLMTLAEEQIVGIRSWQGLRELELK